MYFLMLTRSVTGGGFETLIYCMTYFMNNKFNLINIIKVKLINNLNLNVICFQINICVIMDYT